MSVLAVRSLTEVLVSLFVNVCVFLITLTIYALLLGLVIVALWKLFEILYAHFLGHRLHAVIFGVVVSCLICWLYLK
jgi:hypothetical protein